MNKILNKLPILAFVLAATFAFGAQVPSLFSSDEPQKVWTPDEEEPSGYREITNLTQGVNYTCVGGADECRVEFSNDDPMTGIKNVLTPGVFTNP